MSLKLKPNDATAADGKGFTLLKLGQAERAITEYDAALQINPKLASALYGRGMAKLRKGDKTGGNADMATARNLSGSIAAEFARYGITEHEPKRPAPAESKRPGSTRSQ
jgi:Flp pilus assembly protein TadD